MSMAMAASSELPDAAKKSDPSGQDADRRHLATGFRVVNKLFLTFETDLPPSRVNLHPSGVLHAAAHGWGRAREHAFVWIDNSLRIQAPLSRLSQRGYRPSDIVFIPYSSKENWLRRYPRAVPGLECAEGGTCAGAEAVSRAEKRAESGEDGAPQADAPNGKKKRIYPRKNVMKKFGSFLADAERDELHLEIWNYFRWLHANLIALEETTAQTDVVPTPETASAGASEDDDTDDLHELGQTKKAAAFEFKGGRNTKYHGVDLSELQCVVDKMEATFPIIPNARLEQEAAGEDIMTILQQGHERRQQEKAQEMRQLKPPKKPNGFNMFVKEHRQSLLPAADLAHVNYDRKVDRKAHLTMMGEISRRWKEMTEENRSVYHQKAEEEMERRLSQPTQEEGEKQQKKDPVPLLEEALSEALRQLVKAREVGGRPTRRSRKRQRDMPAYALGPGGKRDFDVYFQRLAKYREEHGNCMVTQGYGDKELAQWVKSIREKRATLRRKGIEVEELAAGEQMTTRALTADRIARLDVLGFAWSAAFGCAPVSWEGRFQEMMDYYETHGRWPSQSMGTMGEWIHKQRRCYTTRDADFMKHRFSKLDEVGFEWTPRGYTRMSWEDGFETLMAFRRISGHFDVPCPVGDKNSQAYRLYRWVESLHGMYGSYKSGRQSGSLTEERIELLRSHGFLFRNS